MREVGRPGVALLAGVGATALAGLLPAGLRGEPVLPSFCAWGLLAVAALAFLSRRAGGARTAARVLLFALPVAFLLAAPAALLAPPGRRAIVLAALLARAGTAVLLAGATAALLGPPGIVAGLRALRVPAGLVDVMEATLASLVLLGDEARAMLRARRARHPAGRPFAGLAGAPVDTVRGYGRLVAALLLRALARAERRELARRARGGAP